MANERSSELIESSASLSAEKVLLKNTLKTAGLRKLRSEIERNEQLKKKQKKGGVFTKRRYFAGLLNNNIVVSNNKSSIKIIDTRNIQKLAAQFKKINTVKKLKDAMITVTNYKPQNLQEKILRSIYLYILEMHLERSWLFTEENVESYSEADFQYKFWSYVFEMFLGSNQDVIIKWGDTIGESCKQAGQNFKLDLHVVMVPDDEHELDDGIGEMAKKATVQKIYKNKFMSIIATKCQLNTFIQEASYICARDVPLIKMPIIQLNGFTGKLLVLSIAKKKEYKLEEVSSFCFPQNLKQIQNGAIEKLVDVLATVDNLLSGLREIHRDNSGRDENEIDKILGMGSQRKFDYNAWITKAIFGDEESNDEAEDGDNEVNNDLENEGEAEEDC